MTQDWVGLGKSWEDLGAACSLGPPFQAGLRYWPTNPWPLFLASMEDSVELATLSLWGVDVCEQ